MLAKSRVGATGSDEDDNQSQTSNHDSLFGKEDCYQVIGTLKDDFSPKPDWAVSYTHLTLPTIYSV